MLLWNEPTALRRYFCPERRRATSALMALRSATLRRKSGPLAPRRAAPPAPPPPPVRDADRCCLPPLSTKFALLPPASEKWLKPPMVIVAAAADDDDDEEEDDKDEEDDAPPALDEWGVRMMLLGWRRPPLPIVLPWRCWWPIADGRRRFRVRLLVVDMEEEENDEERCMKELGASLLCAPSESPSA